MTAILLIEDDAKFADAFATFAARTLKAEVLIAPSLAQAERLLRQFSFDVIVLDLTLEDSNPAGSVAAIDTLSASAPVVVFTGQQGDKAGELRNWSMFNGAADFIQKDHVGSFGAGWHQAMGSIQNAYLRRKASCQTPGKVAA